MSYLTEAFKQLNIIDEDLFPTDSEGLNKLKDFMKSDIDDEDLIVYDDTANNEDEIKASYDGKVILRCNVCKSYFFKEPKSVIIDAEAGLANVGDECCYCHNDMGYNVVGVVAPYVADVSKEERAEDAHEEPAEVDVEVDDIDVKPEDVNESIKKINEETNYDRVMRVLNDMKKEEHIKESLNCAEFANMSDEQLIKYLYDYSNVRKDGLLSISDVDYYFDEEADEDCRDIVIDRIRNYEKSIGAMQFDAADGEAYVIDRRMFNDKIRKIYDVDVSKCETAEDVVKSVNCDNSEEFIFDFADKVDELGESLKEVNEDLKDVSITTDDTKIQMTSEENGKVTVTTEPVKNELDVEDSEVIKPLSAADRDVIANNDGEDGEEVLDDTAIDFDEINDEDLDKLGEKYFTKVYDNVKSFKSTACKLDESGVTLEGKITFKSGKEAKTAFNFNEAYVTKTGKVKLVGENAQFAKNKKAFTLTGSLDNKKLVVESFTYNYRTKDEKTGKSTRLYGTVSK